MPASPPLTRRLLAFRWRALLRRTRGTWPIVAAVTLVALVAAAFLGRALAATSLDAQGRIDLVTVRDDVFWLGTLAALVYSYTSFEVFFRAPDARFLGTLPLPGAARFDDLFVRAVVLHLPLLVPVIAYAIGLLGVPGGADAALYTIVVGLVQFAVGLPLAVMLHLYAGRSLLSRSGDLKKLLAGMSVPDDAALLVYAPALGLLGTLVLGIFIDLAFRDAFFRGKGALLLPVLAVAAVAMVLSVARARAVAREALHLILPRFSEVDVPPPYREDGVRRRVPGEGLARALPALARPYFMRDIRQLRRRYRLDRILLWVFAAVAVKVAFDVPPDRSPVVPVLLALGLMNGVFIVSAFRLRGELASRALDLTLPSNAGAERWARIAACAHDPLIAVLIAAAATAVTGRFGAAALVLAAGLALAALLVFASHAVATLGRERPGLAATAWRVLVTALVVTLGGVA